MRRALGLVLAVLLAGTACTTGDDAVATGSSFEFVSPNGQSDIYYEGADRQPIPELAGPDLFDESKRISVADFAGKVVVINLWGQWCGPCRAEVPELQEVQDRHGDDVQVLGIDVREPNRQLPQDFLRARGITYPSIYDESGRVLLPLSGYPRNIVPSTIVVDERQRVAAVFLRPLLAEDLDPLIERLKAES
ncbi:Thiol-disulfide isomerase or thioredoxin [Amycolatopsis arida]|uniref:Thiol-disulfide isomerase or thioredoxin n=1 Tax=Amycolatopsis arida TaxID=587909 RepID=A0A1I6A9R3_9PSEU|nr:TlpA disulfide reductase family protein [Amycolatopsis arida]TDX88493.1 thiol-disulfide isomerase/thioredoxin [Amycolatopsis arida]SFQ65382.1 Thiol-disulfide isomerase or thioredoxin [Amycolatopsis arida]